MKKNTKSDIIIDVFICFIIILLCVVTIFPFWNSLIVSLSSKSSAFSMGFRLFPEEVDFEAWNVIIKSSYIWRGFSNTVLRTVGGSVITMTLSVLTAYPLSKKDFICKGFFTKCIVFTMLFSGGLIPTYLLIKELGIMNSYWALVIPSAISPFNLIVMKNFFEAIPAEMEESAKIDGANDFLILLRIILPLCTAMLATIGLWTIVGHWNGWFDAVMYINDRSKFVLQVILRELIIQNTPDPSLATTGANAIPLTSESIQSAATMFVTIPILLVYPFLQKYFAGGIMIGAVKG